MYAPLTKIVEAIGLAAAMKLVDHFGGTLTYLPLPKNVDADNEIAKAIGLETALKLAHAWDFDRRAERRIDIPLGRPATARAHEGRDPARQRGDDGEAARAQIQDHPEGPSVGSKPSRASPAQSSGFFVLD